MQSNTFGITLKMFLLVIVAAILFSASVFIRPATAQTAEQLAQLQSLLQMVALLQQQLAALEAGGNPPLTNDALYGKICPQINRLLGLGASGNDVSELQQFLSSTGDYTYGQITGYYGPVTEDAVKKFQCRVGVVCSGDAASTGYGVVGPATRSEIARSCGGYYPPVVTQPVFGPVTCTVGSVTMYQGESRTFFLNSIASSGTSCQSTVRTCQPNGILSGSGAYSSPTCSVQNVQCSVGSTIMQVGETRTFYKNSSVPYGSTCQSTSRTCQANGTVTGDTAYSAASCSAETTPGSCTIPASGSNATTTVPHGTSYTFYSAATVPTGQSCSFISQARTCNNGTFSGSAVYSYPTCTVASNCTLGGVTLKHGESRFFYSTSTLTITSGQQCSSISQLRTCENGVLSGNASYASPSCVVTKDCILNGILVPNGTTKDFYTKSTVLFGQSCDAIKQSRTCTNSVLSGTSTYQYGACKVGDAKNCTLNGKTVEHGKGEKFYSVNSVKYNQDCETYAQHRMCNDGVLSGSPSYSFASCTKAEEKNCTLDGQTFAPGKHKVYSRSTVAVGQKCGSVAEIRTCRNGAWTNDDTGDGKKYNKARCAQEGKAWCKEDKLYVKHGNSALFYATRTVDFGKTCALAISRKCSNGTLSGNSAYKYRSCAPEAPSSCTLDGKTVKHGEKWKFFSAEQGSEEEKCAVLAKERTCYDGVFGGEAEFKFASCVDPVDAEGDDE